MQIKNLTKIVIIGVSLFDSVQALACTAFGLVESGQTILAKNRDERYGYKQSFDLVWPSVQFNQWMDNEYDHNYRFYAVMADYDVKMGINQMGLSTIEEAPPMPSEDRRYIQPIYGYSEGNTMWGMLQNFATVDEIIPYIDQIFSHAAPNYYQIADSNKILTVEVAFAKDDKETTRNYSYKVLDKAGEKITHTNFYLDPQFSALNQLYETSQQHKDALASTKARLDKIKHSLAIRKSDSLDEFDKMFMDFSARTNSDIPNWCLNTSIFRSYLQGESDGYAGMTNHNLYGTQSTFIVINTGLPKTTMLDLKIVDEVNTLANGKQKISYRTLRTTLENLFSKSPNLKYDKRTVIRNKPNGKVCG